MHGDEPADLVHEVLAEALWPGHPLGRDVLGTEDVDRGARTRRHRGVPRAPTTGPANIVLAAAGDLDPRRGGGGDRATLPRAGQAAPRRPARRRRRRPGRWRCVNRPTEQAHLTVGLRGLRPQRRGPLCPGRHRPRARRRDVEPAVPGDPRGAGPGVLGLLLPVACSRGPAPWPCTPVPRRPGPTRCCGLIHDELDRMLDRGVTDRELAMAKRHLRGSLALALEDSGARMSRLGRSQLVHGSVSRRSTRWRSAWTRSPADDVDRVIGRVLGGPGWWRPSGPFGEDDFS